MPNPRESNSRNSSLTYGEDLLHERFTDSLKKELSRRFSIPSKRKAFHRERSLSESRNPLTGT
jgi:hypothetical protein